MSYFDHIAPISYEGAFGDNPLAFHHYDAKRQILGKTMAEHLRLAACYWHTFVWPGSDVFGAGTFDRPWHARVIRCSRRKRKPMRRSIFSAAWAFRSTPSTTPTWRRKAIA